MNKAKEVIEKRPAKDNAVYLMLIHKCRNNATLGVLFPQNRLCLSMVSSILCCSDAFKKMLT